METLFENRCIHSKKNLLEMVRKKGRKSFAVYSYIVIAFLGLNAATRFVRQDFTGAGVLLFLCAAFTGLHFYLPYATVKKMLKRDRALYHTEVSIKILFFNDYLLGIHEQNSGQTKADYSQLVEVSRTKGLYLLSMRENLIWIIDKNGFLKGDGAAFEAFVKEKAAYAKIKL